MRKLLHSFEVHSNENACEKVDVLGYKSHTLVDYLIVHLRERNTGIFCKPGKKFGELIADFIIGIDEMCLMSYAFGYLYVIGAEKLKT